MSELTLSVIEGHFTLQDVENIRQTKEGIWLKKHLIVCDLEVLSSNLIFVWGNIESFSQKQFLLSVEKVVVLCRTFVDVRTLLFTEIDKPSFEIRLDFSANKEHLIPVFASITFLWDSFLVHENIDMGIDFFSSGLSELTGRKVIDRSVSISFSSGEIEYDLNVIQADDYQAQGFVSCKLLNLDYVDEFFESLHLMLVGYSKVRQYRNDPRVISLLEQSDHFFR